MTQPAKASVKIKIKTRVVQIVVNGCCDLMQQRIGHNSSVPSDAMARKT
jgi:hypothetical protein